MSSEQAIEKLAHEIFVADNARVQRTAAEQDWVSYCLAYGPDTYAHEIARRLLDGGHVLRSWRVLRAGAGASTPAQARQRANVVAVASFLTAAALVAGMIVAHVPQDRL